MWVVGSQDSTIGIVTSCGLEGPGLSPIRAAWFSLLQNLRPTFLFTECWGLSVGVRRPRCENEHSPPSNADVKNEWSYRLTITPLHDVDTDKFIFAFLCGWLIKLLNNSNFQCLCSVTIQF
jgi:hypothetical protein